MNCLQGVLFGTALGAAVSFGAGNSLPNIVLILADDIGYESIGAYGCESYQTPRIDQMAREGVLFSNCYSQPLCSPSRVKIMTGKYNNRNYTRFGELTADQFTFAQMLKDIGYVTAISGKWQLGGGTEGVRDFGFDQLCLWNMPEEHDVGSRYADPVVNLNGEWSDGLDGKYGPDIFSDFVCDFMEQNKEEPFFVYYTEVLPHDPFQPTPDSGVPLWKTNRGDKRYYKDMVEYLDKMVGKILDKVEQLDSDRDTLIIFTGDNGTNPSIKDTVCNGKVIFGGKGSPTDAGTHVPLIVRWVGHAVSGAVCDDLIDFSDIFPTLAAAAGIPLSEDLGIDGRSFLPQVKGKAGDPRDWVFCHYDPRLAGLVHHPRLGDRVPCRFVHDKRWKLFGNGQFFDLSKDLREEHPLKMEDLPEDAIKIYVQFLQVLDDMPRRDLAE